MKGVPSLASSVVFEAASGERNDVVPERRDGEVTVRDGSSLVAGTGCVQQAERQALCSTRQSATDPGPPR